MILIHIEDGGTTASQEWGPDGARPGTTASQEKGPGWSSPWNHAAIVWQCNICEWMILVFFFGISYQQTLPLRGDNPL